MGLTPYPSSFEALTPEWLTSAMRESGSLPAGQVSGLSTERFAEGVGFMGQIAKLKLTFDGAGESTRTDYVIKLPSPYEANRQMCVDYRIYEKEHLFYRELAPKVPVNVPTATVNVFNPEDHSFVLMLEDLAPAVVGDEVGGMPDELIATAVREIARLHARFWESDDLKSLDWVPYLNGPLWRAHKQFWEYGWPVFREFRGDSISPYVLECGDRMVGQVNAMQDLLCEPPCTVFHMDFRLSNMFFGTPAGGPEFTLIDWQPFSRGRGLYDVGYLLSQSLPIEQRRRLEQDLLRLYHETIQAHGVRDYSFDQVFRDYRLGIMYCLLYPMGTGAIDLSNEAGKAFADRITERSAAAIDDLRTGDLIPG